MRLRFEIPECFYLTDRPLTQDVAHQCCICHGLVPAGSVAQQTEYVRDGVLHREWRHRTCQEGQSHV